MTEARVRLLFLAGASGYERNGSIWLTDEQVRKWAGLARAFEATLVAAAVPASRRRTAHPPDGTRVMWIRPREGWRRLAPTRSELVEWWKRLREADAFLAFMPETAAIVPLFVAWLARRPRYLLVQATAPHFRSWNADGAAWGVASRVVLNA